MQLQVDHFPYTAATNGQFVFIKFSSTALPEWSQQVYAIDGWYLWKMVLSFYS